MAMLHTVNKSPFERNTLTTCLGLAKEGSSVLLLEDGVIAALNNTAHSDMIKSAVNHLNFYVLGPDVQARGLNESNIIDNIEIVDYARFVDLVTSHENVQSWL